MSGIQAGWSHLVSFQHPAPIPPPPIPTAPTPPTHPSPPIPTAPLSRTSHGRLLRLPESPARRGRPGVVHAEVDVRVLPGAEVEKPPAKSGWPTRVHEPHLSDHSFTHGTDQTESDLECF